MDPFLSHLGDDPLATAAAWLAQARAAGLHEPEAAALATADAAGRPSVRMVLVRGLDATGLRFFTNRESRKGRELAENPHAAIVLHWGPPLGRQVRVEGRVAPLDEDASYAYFATRPRGSRLGAWASPQSRPLRDREELDRRLAEVEERFAGVEDPPLPPFWGGYLLVPEVVELWQGRPDRLHDRARYARTGDAWSRERLAP